MKFKTQASKTIVLMDACSVDDYEKHKKVIILRVKKAVILEEGKVMVSVCVCVGGGTGVVLGC